jgi:diacylglycerol kinase family enzyme
LDARIIRSIGENRKGTLGSLGYVVPMLRTLFTYPETALRVTLDGSVRARGAMVIVANIRQYAWNLEAADRARSDSGKLDVVLLHQQGPFALFRYMWQARRHRLSSAKGVSYFQANSIRIESEDGEQVDVQRDGEIHGILPVTITLHAGMAPFIVHRIEEHGSRDSRKWPGQAAV